jgi:predicted kinase
VIFDAILVKCEERAPILAQAAQHGVPTVAVWFRTPLELCLSRNRRRPTDQVANEIGLRNVFAALEPPREQEGFATVLLVNGDAFHSLGEQPTRLPILGSESLPSVNCPDLGG